MRYASKDQLRQIDQQCEQKFCMATLQLMENAGRGAADWISSHRPKGRVVILCGPGNNGGDGFVIARHLDDAGFAVEVYLIGNASRLGGDALTNFRIIQAMKLPLHENPDATALSQLLIGLSDSDTIIDGVLGTGASLPLRDQMRWITAVANRSSAYRIALDIPTGFDADSGEADDDCFRAETTLTFAASKLGFRSQESKQFTGSVVLISIGAPRCVIDSILHRSSADRDHFQ